MPYYVVLFSRTSLVVVFNVFIYIYIHKLNSNKIAKYYVSIHRRNEEKEIRLSICMYLLLHLHVPKTLFRSIYRYISANHEQCHNHACLHGGCCLERAYFDYGHFWSESRRQLLENFR